MSLRTLHVSTPEETVAAIESFNGFHDGFMKRIEITSLDTTSPTTVRHAAESLT